MHITFVNLVHEFNEAYFSYTISMPPICLGVLANLTPKDIDVSLIDEQCDKLNFGKGDVFAFTLATQLAKKVYHHADILRKQGKKVIIGGYHPTIRPKEVAEHADAVVVGEAETVWPTICKDLKEGTLKKFYKSRDIDLAKSPVVKRDLFKGKRYHMPNTILVTRGCPFTCSFCVSSRILGGYRTRPMDMVEEEIKLLKSENPKALFMLVDDHPFNNDEFNEQLFALFKKHKIRWITQISVDKFCDKEFMKRAADSGLYGVLVGIENLNPENNESIDKFQNLNQNLEESLKYAKKLGVYAGALLLFGLDYDTPDSIKKTVKELKKMEFILYNICLLRVYPNTSIYDEMLADNRIEKDWWISDKVYNWNKDIPGFMGIYYTPKNIDARELQEITLDAYVELNHVLDRRLLSFMFRNAIKGHFAQAIHMFAARYSVTRLMKKFRRRIR